MRDQAESDRSVCVFCRHEKLSHILHETEHFLLLADHAPVVEGHVLILPRTHFACYGSVPASLDTELLNLKAMVASFCRETYQSPVFFEHGVYRQTVFHAHLHAMPLGTFPEDIVSVAAGKGAPIATQADIRSWYQERGQYFYLERLGANGNPAQATIFPPSEPLYHQVLGILRTHTGEPGGWKPQPVRRLTSDQKVRALASAWQRYMGQRYMSSSVQ